MKTVTRAPCFQGELMIREVDAIPVNVVKTAGTAGKHIVAHSESGHHHVVDCEAADRFIDQMNSFISYLSVASDTEVEHLRTFDTHVSWKLEAGKKYEVRLQREHTPEGFRPAQD